MRFRLPSFARRPLARGHGRKRMDVGSYVENFGRDIVADYTWLERECRAGVFPLARPFDDYFGLDHHDTCGEVNPALSKGFGKFRRGALATPSAIRRALW